jgi:hypothetical protein
LLRRNDCRYGEQQRCPADFRGRNGLCRSHFPILYFLTVSGGSWLRLFDRNQLPAPGTFCFWMFRNSETPGVTAHGCQFSEYKANVIHRLVL